MANGIGSVWAANFGEDGKPNGVGSVWIENASAFSGGGGAGDEEVNTLVHTNSGTWNTVTDKLDTSSFSDVSGTFLTAHQSLADYIPYSASGLELPNSKFKIDTSGQAYKISKTPITTRATSVADRYAYFETDTVFNKGVYEVDVGLSVNTTCTFKNRNITVATTNLTNGKGNLVLNNNITYGSSNIEVGFGIHLDQGTGVTLTTEIDNLEKYVLSSELPTYEYDSTNKISAINGSAIAGGGSSDTFYIYPGTTTDKEISENSGKDLKLYNSANNVFLDFAGKSTYSTYSIFSFKGVTGTQYNQNTVQNLRLRVYPNATSACKVYDTNSVNLLDNTSTVSQANTAYYDAGGYSLTQTRSDFEALNSFVQSNSANWEGGSAPASEGVLFHFYKYQPSEGGKGSTDSYIANASDLYFEACVDSNYSTPNNVIIEQNGSFVGEAYWTQVSSDGSNNYYTASYNGLSNGEYKLNNNGFDSYIWCAVSANGVRTYAFDQGQYKCSTDKAIKFNVQGYNITGTIDGINHGSFTPLTSFTGSLTDFTAKGYEEYSFNINTDDYYSDSNYNLSAEFVAGSTVASGDVFPPTNNLDPYATYYLVWNANNGGLFWYNPGNGGN